MARERMIRQAVTMSSSFRDDGDAPGGRLWHLADKRQVAGRSLGRIPHASLDDLIIIQQIR
jgi:hypothetical protein